MIIFVIYSSIDTKMTNDVKRSVYASIWQNRIAKCIKKYTSTWVQQTMAATQKLEHAQVFVSHINLFSISTIEKRSFAKTNFFNFHTHEISQILLWRSNCVLLRQHKSFSFQNSFVDLPLKSIMRLFRISWGILLAICHIMQIYLSILPLRERETV